MSMKQVKEGYEALCNKKEEGLFMFSWNVVVATLKALRIILSSFKEGLIAEIDLSNTIYFLWMQALEIPFLPQQDGGIIIISITVHFSHVDKSTNVVADSLSIIKTYILSK